MPYFVSYAEALFFLESQKKSVLAKQKESIRKAPKQTLFLPGVVFHTHKRTLRFIAATDASPTVKMEENFISVLYSDIRDVEKKHFQDSIKDLIISALRIEAKEYLPLRVEYLAERHNFSYNKVSVRNARTRWGSCSGSNNISLNIHLMRLPDHLRDYVILHELCHTVEKNHGERFWKLMQQVSPQALNHNQELKKYSLIIF